MQESRKVDYYEFLQISPNADQDTIHRVYRFLAARYHPDNPASGNADTFSTLTAAYEVLSDPDLRMQYDSDCAREKPKRPPLSSSIDFMDNLDGETNRRLAVLAVLYYKRRTNPQQPEVSLTEIEIRMGFPRDYLDFTTWYLLRKSYITRADNSDFTLTAQGVDFVETQRVNIPILNKLLTDGSEEVTVAAAAPEQASTAHTAISNGNGNGIGHGNGNGRAAHAAAQRNGVTILPAVGVALAEERRLTGKDRRANSNDRRKSSGERRSRS